MNVGELEHRFIDDLGVMSQLTNQYLAWSGQSVWGGFHFFGAGVIKEDLHLQQFAARPAPPPEWTQVFQSCLAIPHSGITNEDWAIHCYSVAQAWDDPDY